MTHIGLHTPVYISVEEMDQLKKEAIMLSMFLESGILAQPSALELLAVRVLAANGHIAHKDDHHAA